MASFTFNVNGQNFELIEDEAHVSDSVRYLDASFSFDERWDGLRKFLIFEKGSESYKVEIVDNRIRPEANIILADGPWKVSVIGEKVVGDDLVKRITTDPQRIIIKKSGIKNGDPFPGITPTIGEQIVERAASEADRAEEAAGQAAESAGVAESAANNASLFSDNAKSQAERAESAENASKRYAEDAKDEAETASFFADNAFNNAQEAKRQADRSEASMFEAQYQAEEAKRAADEAKHNTYDDTEVRELIAGNTEEIEKVNETTSELSDGLTQQGERIKNAEDVIFRAVSPIVNIDFETISHKYIRNDGIVLDISGSNYKVSESIDVSNISKVYISASASYGNGLYAFYGVNGAVVERRNSTGGSVHTILTDEVVNVPSTAKTLVIAWNSYQNTGSVKCDGQATELIPRKKWDDKKWVCVGDSLTEVNIRTTMHYHDYIADETGINVVNMGVSGSGYKKKEDVNQAFYQRVLNIPTDADVYTIFGSGNDNGYDLGTALDTSTATICGCINKTLDNIFSVNPLAVVGIVSPCPWDTHNPKNKDDFMSKLSVLMKEICENRGIPYLDLFHNSGLRPWEAQYRNLCYTKDGGSGTHPDETGHKLLAPRFKGFLETLIM